MVDWVVLVSVVLGSARCGAPWFAWVRPGEAFPLSSSVSFVCAVMVLSLVLAVLEKFQIYCAKLFIVLVYAT